MAAAIVAVILLGAAAGAVLFRGGGDDDRGLSAFSNRGTPIELAVPQLLAAKPRVTGKAILIEERNGIRFVRLPREDGSSCWGTAEQLSGAWSVTNYACETGFTRFPDERRPVMVMGRLEIRQNGDDATSAYQSFSGFAADGVARIGVLDRRNRLIEVTDVVENIFFTPEPSQDVKRVVALDSAGEIIWRGAEARIRVG